MTALLLIITVTLNESPSQFGFHIQQMGSFVAFGAHVYIWSQVWPFLGKKVVDIFTSESLCCVSEWQRDLLMTWTTVLQKEWLFLPPIKIGRAYIKLTTLWTMLMNPQVRAFTIGNVRELCIQQEAMYELQAIQRKTD